MAPGRAEEVRAPVPTPQGPELRLGPFSARRVPVEARGLRTVGPDDGFWKGDAIREPWGELVRVLPPADATDEVVARAEAAFYELGAAKVRVGARAAGKATIPAGDRSPAPLTARRSIRDVCKELVAEARVDDRSALSVLVDRLLSEAGA